jgi:hypothetical protein
MWKVYLVALGVGLLGEAAEIVKLRNGVRLEADRVEREGDSVWLHTRAGIQYVASADVLSIEEPGAEKKKPAAPPVFAARSTQSTPTRRMIDEAAWRHGLPPAIVHAVAQSESAYNQKAISTAGAIGVMQLMPYTAAALGANPRDEAENIDAGTRYLREMLVKFQHHPDQVALAVAAYNAGPGAVQRYQGVPPYSETRTYVRRVIGKYEKMAEPEAFQPPPPPVALPVAPAVPDIPVPHVDRPTVAGLN